jgi:septal ring factor EnvC (AmiA/AmiB activator)
MKKHPSYVHHYQINEITEKLSDLELQVEEHKKKNIALTDENKTLNTTLRKLKIENTKLEAIRKSIMSTLENEVEAVPLQERDRHLSIKNTEDQRTTQQQYISNTEKQICLYPKLICRSISLIYINVMSVI